MPAELMATSASSSTSIEDLNPDVLTRTLRLLDGPTVVDGPTLAAACSASSYLRSLSSQSDLWLHLCLSTWPSLHHPRILPFLSTSPRSFFSNAFPFPEAFVAGEVQLPNQLISAVDIYHRGTHVFSRVIDTDSSSPWFRGSPLLIDAMEQKAEALLPGASISPNKLTLSWILIDPAMGQPVNVSSRRAVGMERNSYTGETMVRFASAAPAGEIVIGPVVTCEEGTGHMRDVVLTAGDIDGAYVSGEKALKVLRAMMEARRKGRGRLEEEEDAKQRYLEYLRRK
ncbi:F-box protein At2g27310-like [Dendrobium catenatum]|nr:F-box protein At2g27310-like [Dendrobium catenatum]